MALFSPNQTKKLQLVYFPFLKVTISFIGIYTFLHWYFIIHLNLFSFHENIINFWLPICLPWVFVWIILRPKVKLLNLEHKHFKLSEFSIFTMASSMIVPTIIAQHYIVTATGNLTNLNNISEISKNQPSKYYSLKNSFIDKKHINVNSFVMTSGKRNRDFNMYIYIALPILKNQADTTERHCENWYGVKYFQTISNKKSEEEKQSRYQNFIAKSHANFDSLDVRKFIYLDKIGFVDDRERFMSSIKNNRHFESNSPILLLPVNQPFEDRNGNKFLWFLGSFTSISSLFLLFLLKRDFKEDE
jgi:rhomboid protease GluP